MIAAFERSAARRTSPRLAASIGRIVPRALSITPEDAEAAGAPPRPGRHAGRLLYDRRAARRRFDGLLAGDKLFVDLLIRRGHCCNAEVLFDVAAASFPVEALHRFDRNDELFSCVGQHTGYTIRYHFRSGALRSRDDGRAAGHGLDHDEAERLGPVDGKEERAGGAEQRLLFRVADLADVAHERMVEPRLDLALEVS